MRHHLVLFAHRLVGLLVCLVLLTGAPVIQADSPAETGDKPTAAAEKKKELAAKKNEKNKKEQAAAASAAAEKDKAADKSEPKDAEAGKAGESQPTASGKPTTEVTRGPLQIEVTLSGHLESTAMEEVSIAPKLWSQLIVVEVVDAGTKVKKGDTLLKLDTTKIDESIQDLESTRALAEISLKQAEENFKILERSIPLDTKIADRTKQIAEQDYELYLKVDAPLAKKTADFQLKSSQQSLEYATEELKQLEKMYKADDLTEETEEIILKRSRNDVERSQHFADLAKARHEKSVNFELPRSDEQQALTLEQAKLAWERAKLALSASQHRQKLELDKNRLEYQRTEEKLAEMKRDRELLTVKAPADGTVFYGRSQNGKWSTAAAMSLKFRSGGQIAPHETLFTIVSEPARLVRATVPEKDVSHVRAGVAGKLKPTAYPKARIPVRVTEVAPIPSTDGSFEVTLELLQAPEQPLIAGMSGDVALGVYFNADALTIPSKAVLHEELDDQKQFVYVVGADGKPEKRSVTTGYVKGDKTEIVSGLSATDKVLLEKP